MEDVLLRCGAVTEGHFISTKGLHLSRYINAIKIGVNPLVLSELCRSMVNNQEFVKLARQKRPGFIACPAEAAIGFCTMLGYWYNEYCNYTTSGCPYFPRPVATLYASKDPEQPDHFIFRREQEKALAGKKGIVLDDLGTTGSSVKGVVEAVRENGGEVCMVTYAIIRGNVTPESVGGVETIWAPLTLNLDGFTAEECPMCAQGIPINLELGHGRTYVAEHGQPTDKR